MTAEAARTHFDELVSWAAGGLEADEVLTAWFSGEDSDFVRFNDGAIRQAGSVAQRSITIDLIMGDVHTGGSLQLAQDVELDRRRIERLLAQLRQQRELVSSDPYLSYATDGASSERIFPGALPAPADAIDEIRHAAADRDLVGIYAAGDTFHGFANSLGQRNWSQSTTFNLDWSFYLEADKAVKSLYAGQSWDSSALATKVERASQQLAVMGREPIDLAPGAYRTYLTPAALTELVGLLAWGGFGLRSHRTKRTPLLKMITEGAAMAPSVHLAEDTAGGIGPDFQAQGFLRPEQVKLIDGGRYADCLVSPRSAREYGVVNNGADDDETPLSLAMQPGQLPTSEVLDHLDTGLYVGNLWYLNYSDPVACRTTGMTRFGTYWVERGEIVAPVNVLRFDDTAYNLLGQNLEGLTDSVEVMLDPSTYEGRSVESLRLPGALVGEMRFTL